MKDLLKRGSIGLICVLFLGYLIYLLIWSQTIVQIWFIDQNILYYVVLAIVFLYILIFFSIVPTYFKISKWSLFLLWLALILLWDGVLINNPDKQIYLADLVKLIWVVITLLSFSNFFITSKLQKQHQDKKVKVIEV